MAVFTNFGLEGRLQALLFACGMVSLAGLIGVPLGKMGIRNIGISGFGLLAPVVFFLLGVMLGCPRGPQP